MPHAYTHHSTARTHVQHQPVEGMAWLVSGLLHWCCMVIPLSPHTRICMGSRLAPPVNRKQVFGSKPSMYQVPCSWRAVLLALNKIFTYLVLRTKPIRAQSTVVPAWPAVVGLLHWWTAALQDPVDRGASLACS